MKLPKELVNIITEEKVQHKPHTILKLDYTYKLLDIEDRAFGERNFCGLDTGNVGHTLESIYLFLEGTIPEKGHITSLPNIEISKDNYANITIFTESGEFFWVLLVDNTDQVNDLRKIVQELNQSVFKDKKMLSTKSDQAVGIGLLNSMDFVVLLRNPNNEEVFQRVGKSPEWLVKLTSEHSLDWNQISLAELFPYIEVFLIEAQHLWHSDRFTKTSSNVWTEFDAWGNEYFLQAFAVNLNGADYILISPTDMSIEERQTLIQKAREKSLDYERLEKTEAALKRLVTFKDRFVSMVSHDLRAPLGMLAVYANRLAKKEDLKTKLNEKQNRSLNIMDKELNRLSEYINKLYHWSNLELGRFILNKKEINLAKLVNNTLEVYETKIANKKLIFECDITENLTIQADESLFEQVLNNLVGNAIKFTKKEGKILISASEDEKSTYLKIRDEGIGISQEAQAKIFEETVSEHTFGTEGEEGSGLGLQICKQIIAAHEFEISFTSKEGEGTEFVITAKHPH